jgi:hypothetical protein
MVSVASGLGARALASPTGVLAEGVCRITVVDPLISVDEVP